MIEVWKQADQRTTREGGLEGICGSSGLTSREASDPFLISPGFTLFVQEGGLGMGVGGSDKSQRCGITWNGGLFPHSHI